jgi:16S rRNA (adenine1518-N6/adenine1519-N6)-dimethyltransferase
MKPRRQRTTYSKKSLGQNFLVDPEYIDQIIAAVAPRKTEAIVEIGPGRGALTEKLVESGANVVAIELDKELVPDLRERFANYPNLRVVEGDILAADLVSIVGDARSMIEDPGRTKLVANLPYNISTAILQGLIEQRHIFDDLVLMFQREVVDRITAKPGNSDRGFLTVLIEAYFSTEHLFDVPPKAFRPIPKVWSSVVRMKPKATEIELTRFRELVSIAFGQKRKTILNNLKHIYPNAEGILTKAGIVPMRRAESLELEEWLSLDRVISSASKNRNGDMIYFTD